MRLRMEQDPDRAPIEVTPELAAEQERLEEYAARAAYLFVALKRWDLPDSAAEQLTTVWLSERVSADLRRED